MTSHSIHNHDLEQYLTPREVDLWSSLNDPARLALLTEQYLADLVRERRSTAVLACEPAA